MAVAPFGSVIPTIGVVTTDRAGQTRSATAWIAVRNGRFTVSGTMTADVSIDVVGYVTGASAAIGQTGLYRSGRNSFA